MRVIFILALATLIGCATQEPAYHFRVKPPVVITFSVGDRVAFTTKSHTMWEQYSNPQSFWLEKGDTGKVIDILYYPTFVVYYVLLDKSGKNERIIAHAHDGFIEERECHDIEAIVYPDGALRPNK